MKMTNSYSSFNSEHGETAELQAVEGVVSTPVVVTIAAAGTAALAGLGYGIHRFLHRDLKEVTEKKAAKAEEKAEKAAEKAAEARKRAIAEKKKNTN